MKYVRWGRTKCPSGAQIVYKGIKITEHGIIRPAFHEKKILHQKITAGLSNYACFASCFAACDKILEVSNFSILGGYTK